MQRAKVIGVCSAINMLLALRTLRCVCVWGGGGGGMTQYYFELISNISMSANTYNHKNKSMHVTNDDNDNNPSQKNSLFRYVLCMP